MYKVFPPYIDAYRVGVTAENVKDAMKDIALEWGEQSIGRAVLSGNDAAELHGKKVLACAHNTSGLLPDLLLLAPANELWFEKTEIVEGYIDLEWDVT